VDPLRAHPPERPAGGRHPHRLARGHHRNRRTARRARHRARGAAPTRLSARSRGARRRHARRGGARRDSVPLCRGARRGGPVDGVSSGPGSCGSTKQAFQPRRAGRRRRALHPPHRRPAAGDYPRTWTTVTINLRDSDGVAEAGTARHHWVSTSNARH
jgi:hypothetical protein